MLLIALAACQPDPVETDAPAPPIGEPIVAPAGEWTWVDVDGTSCDDGTPTGLAIDPGTDDKLLVFLTGGGACWDYVTCFIAGTAAHGPFGEEQWNGTPNSLGGTIFDWDDPNNPFATWSYVFVPYCTGDSHGGDKVATYTDHGDSKTYHHTGHANVLRDLERLAPTFPAPEQIVVSGASAGGGGVLLNYATFRWYWPDVEMDLLDDSLPLMEGDAIQPWLRQTWADAWDLHPLMDPICPECTNDFSRLHVELSERWPDDRMALLSSEQDATIPGYLLMSGPHYQDHLLELDADVLQPTANWERFFVRGDSHTMVGDPARFRTSDDHDLWPWLTQFAVGDPAWTSVGP